jgi:protein-S-isoprenylcysteine O-methyltransferase Ste14
MEVVVYLFAVALVLGIAFLVFRVVVRRDYQRKGRLTLLSSCLELLVWGLFMGFPSVYNPPGWAAFWSSEVPVTASVRIAGITCITLGLVSAFGTMIWFGIRRAFGLEVNKLIQSGPYRLSRNPQVVAGWLLVIGTILLWPSWYALGWAMMYGGVAHMMVVTEEEHLREAFEEEYVKYCERVPRYLRFWPRS